MILVNASMGNKYSTFRVWYCPCWHLLVTTDDLDLKGGRHLHEIFNESIIFMSHFSIGMIDIHKKINLRFFF